MGIRDNCVSRMRVVIIAARCRCRAHGAGPARCEPCTCGAYAWPHLAAFPGPRLPAFLQPATATEL